jgi:hypothetical protein
MTNPTLKRDAAPAPEAVINGTTPNTIAAVVIRIGRSRIPAAWMIASVFERPAMAVLPWFQGSAGD